MSLSSLRGDVGAKADAVAADPALDHLVEGRERSTADEEDVGRVDRQELLVGVLAPTLRRHRGGGALEDLQQRLLDALAGDVARDRRVVGLARDLVDLVDVDDPGLGLLHIEVGGLDQLQEDVLDVLADVAGLGQRGGVGDRERDVEDPGEGLGQKRLAAAGRAEQHDVRLLQLDVVLDRVLGHLNALVVVVDGDREHPLGGLLADHVLLEDVVDLERLREALELEGRRRGELLVDDLVAEIDALIADVDARAGDQLLDLALRLAAEAAEKLLVGVGWACHCAVSLRLSTSGAAIAQITARPASAGPGVVTRPRASSLPAADELQRYGAGGVAWPLVLAPQQASVPSVLIAQVSVPPALTALKLPAGGVAWPLVLKPQQMSVASVLIAQAWFAPALTAMKLPAGGVAWP